MCVDCETWQYLDMFRVNLKNNATDLFGVSSMRLFSSLVFAMTTTISSLIFVTYTSLSVASLNTFKRSVAIANSDRGAILYRAHQSLFRVSQQHMIILQDSLFSQTWLSLSTSPHSHMLALAGTVADGHVLYRSIRFCPPHRHGTAGWRKGNAVADGASQDCRTDQANRYEYISARAFPLRLACWVT